MPGKLRLVTFDSAATPILYPQGSQIEMASSCLSNNC
ncbi:Uncharacterised protein [Vibrio cholerae]|uniref:Uncharacterized protein n=1 Tax=Vibrio cholerae TaxID=666 RepID=A0A655PNE8_VIBCL|nr:Uncharacterised protein [Vibrio cholerae]